MAGGRPKGSKNKPKWLKEAMALNKRPRGRPKGSKTAKTVPDLVARVLSEGVEKPKLPPERPKGPPIRPGGNPTLNDVPPEVRRERALKASRASAAKRKALGVGFVPPGWTLKQVAVVNEMAKEHAQRMIKLMAEAGVLPEDEGAQEAMGTVLGIMRTTASNDMKLKAARTVLEYTKAKPTSKAELTVKTAEDFLDELAEKDEPATE